MTTQEKEFFNSFMTLQINARSNRSLIIRASFLLCEWAFMFLASKLRGLGLLGSTVLGDVQGLKDSIMKRPPCPNKIWHANKAHLLLSYFFPVFWMMNPNVEAIKWKEHIYAVINRSTGRTWDLKIYNFVAELI